MAVASTLPSRPDLEDSTAPAEEQKLTPARLARENIRHDRILAGLLVVFTFLLVSFPVTNHDIWTQLRSGKMLVEGDYRFGIDPFSYTTEGVYWANTGWLSNILFYAVYSLGGGPALVLMRGVIALAILALLFAVRRRDGSLFVSVILLGLTALTMSHRLYVRTELLSMLLLALTLYLLWRPAGNSREGLLGKLLGWTHGRAWVFLPLVFALWANLDGWFILGPAAVALVLAGEWIQSALSAGPTRRDVLDGRELRTLFIVLLVGLAACFLNPHHYHVWQAPGELASRTLEAIKAHQPGIRIGVSPFDFANYLSPQEVWYRPRGLSLSQWCYYVLAAVSALSFLLNMKSLSWPRMLLWVAFFGLSAWQARNAAYFAIVAGPLAVLNLHDWLRSRFGTEPTLSTAWVAVGQVGRIVALFALVGLSVALLMLRPQHRSLQVEGREAALGILHHLGALGWSMSIDPSLRHSAEQMAEWRAAGALPGRGFSLIWHEQPPYANWFDPEGKSFMDTRFRLYENSVDEFYDVFRNLSRTGQGDDAARDPYWQAVFRKYDISHLIVNAQMRVDWTDPVTRRRERPLLIDLLLMDRARDGNKKWEQLDYSDGRTLVLAWTGWHGWKDPSGPHWATRERLRYNPEREAFTGPTRLPLFRGRADVETTPPLRAWLAGEVRRRPLACDEANWHTRHARTSREQSEWEALTEGLSHSHRLLAMSLAGVATPPLPHMNVSLSGSAPILAVRAARRAIADNPFHPDSYYELFKAYQALREHEGFIAQVTNATRDVQMISALRQAVQLDPKVPLWHMELSAWYYQRSVSDLCIAHYQAALAALRELGLGEGNTPEEREKSRVQSVSAFMNLQMERLESQFRNLRADYNSRAALMRDPIERAQHALQLSLLDQARLDLELAVQRLPATAPFQPRDNEAFRQLTQLYLQLGHLPEAMMLLSRPDAIQRLQPGPFHHAGAQVAAADGNYEAAIAHRQFLDEIFQAVSVDQALSGVTTQLLGGESSPPGSGLRGLLSLREGVDMQRQRADLLCESGLLLLEAGRTVQAAEFFRRAVENVHAQSGFSPLAARYYHLITRKSLGSSPAAAPEANKPTAVTTTPQK